MLSSGSTWTSFLVITVAAVSVLSVLIFKKKKKNYVKVGKINKLFFYPVKSLKAVEVTKGRCTKHGFEVDGFLDRSFMLIDKTNSVITQKEAPSLVLLTPEVKENCLIIKSPEKEELKIHIKKSPTPDDKTILCKVITDTAEGIDCGNEAAVWFESYLKMDGVRLVQFFPKHHARKSTKGAYIKFRKSHPASFQNVSAFHIVSKASIDDINSRVEREITVLNFRPNILIEECETFAEDSWQFLKFGNGAEMINLLMKARCLITTNDPKKGVLDMKEPLNSLRKYRIPADPEVIKMTGRRACVGICCGVTSPGEIEVGNDVFAVVGEKPKMTIQDT